MTASEHSILCGNTPQAVGVTTTLVTSQKILGFPWIQEIVQGSDYDDVTGNYHGQPANELAPR